MVLGHFMAEHSLSGSSSNNPTLSQRLLQAVHGLLAQVQAHLPQDGQIRLLATLQGLYGCLLHLLIPLQPHTTGQHLLCGLSKVRQVKLQLAQQPLWRQEALQL
jgi:hypothetical protein